jgi:hypothetical protein
MFAHGRNVGRRHVQDVWVESCRADAEAAIRKATGEGGR